MLRTEDVIGIFDMDTATVGTATKRLLTKAQKEKRLENVSDGLPKSFLLTAPVPCAFPEKSVKKEKPEKGSVWLSPLAPQTLAQRSTVI